jgi:F0F1-type ATP synthase assembly protein I
MMAVMGAGVWAGMKLDSWLQTRPWFLILLSLIAIIASIFVLIKSLPKE